MTADISDEVKDDTMSYIGLEIGPRQEMEMLESASFCPLYSKTIHHLQNDKMMYFITEHLYCLFK